MKLVLKTSQLFLALAILAVVSFADQDVAPIEDGALPTVEVVQNTEARLRALKLYSQESRVKKQAKNARRLLGEGGAKENTAKSEQTNKADSEKNSKQQAANERTQKDAQAELNSKVAANRELDNKAAAASSAAERDKKSANAAEAKASQLATESKSKESAAKSTLTTDKADLATLTTSWNEGKSKIACNNKMTDSACEAFKTTPGLGCALVPNNQCALTCGTCTQASCPTCTACKAQAVGTRAPCCSHCFSNNVVPNPIPVPPPPPYCTTALLQRKLVEDNLPEDGWQEIMKPPVRARKAGEGRKLLGSGCQSQCQENLAKGGEIASKTRTLQEQGNKESANKQVQSNEYKQKQSAAVAQEQAAAQAETAAENNERSAKQELQDSEEQECVTKKSTEATDKQVQEVITKEKSAKTAVATFWKNAATGCYDEDSTKCVSFKAAGLCSTAAAQMCRRTCGACS